MAKSFDPIAFDLTRAQIELGRYKQLLDSKPWLGERDDILPFFGEHRQVAALLGTWNAEILIPDRIAFEYDLFGDYKCDLVIGRSTKPAFCFVEFEDAQSKSVFLTRANRQTADWAPRFERAYRQVVDWH